MPQQSNVLIDFTKWVIKWVAILVSGLITIGLLIAAIVQTWDYWFYQRPKQQIQVVAINTLSQPKPQGAKFSKVEPEKLCTDKAYPIFVGYVNGSKQTIEHIKIGVSARLPERSTNILTYDAELSSDRIVEPNEGWAQCYRFMVDDAFKSDPDVAKALYSAKVNSVQFKED